MSGKTVLFLFTLFVIAIGMTTASLVDLTDGDYNNVMDSKNDEHKTMIKFYAPWCGHCKALEPTYEQLAESFADNNKVTIARVDCTKNDALCTAYQIRGFPTLKLVTNNKAYDFQEARTLESLQKFIEETYENSESSDAPTFQAPVKADTSKIVQLSDSNFSTFAKSITGNKRVFIKFYAPWCGHCKAFEPTIAELATHYAGNPDVVIARVDCTENKETCHTFGIRAYPTTKFLHEGNVYNYQNARSFDAIKEYIETGYKSAEGTKIPSTSFITKMMSELDNGVTMIIADYKELQEKKKGIVSVIIIVALSIGCTIGFCAGISCWCLVANDPRNASEEEEEEENRDTESKKNK